MAVAEIITFEKIIEFIAAGSSVGLGILGGVSFTILGLIAIILGISALLFWLLVGFGGIFLWAWMFIDCVQRKFKKTNQKTLWLVILILSILIGTPLWLHLFASAVYYFIVKKPSEKPKIKSKEKKK